MSIANTGLSGFQVISESLYSTILRRADHCGRFSLVERLRRKSHKTRISDPEPQPYDHQRQAQDNQQLLSNVLAIDDLRISTADRGSVSVLPSI
jgi:hypothetical protein